MILTIWRHGEAGSAPTDFARELTRYGRETLITGTAAYRAACEKRRTPLPSRLLYSPWCRTTQTAEIIGTALPVSALVAESALQPDTSLTAINTALEDSVSQDSAEHIMLVSHQPMVSHLINDYLGEFGKVPGLTPGGFAVLDLPVLASACATLLFWALPPAYEVAL